MPDRVFDENEKSSAPTFADYRVERTEILQQTEEEAVEHLCDSNSHPDQKPHSLFPKKSSTIPVIAEVLAYFHEHNFPEIEANKFFNYFQSIGWLVGGKTPMVEWSAAARNWMLNATKNAISERKDRTKHLDNSIEKDYAEPL